MVIRGLLFVGFIMLSVLPPQRAHSDKRRAWQDIVTRHTLSLTLLVVFCLKIIPVYAKGSDYPQLTVVSAMKEGNNFL